MSSSHQHTGTENAYRADPVAGQSGYRSRGCGSGWGRKGNWTGSNIAAMVVGFVFFWPLGLVVLYWIIRGRNVRDLPAAAKHQWSKMFDNGDCLHGSRSDNGVFNAFQQTQYDRIKEIKEEIRERQRRFAEFRSDARRRADEEEFNRFMASAPSPDAG